MFTAMYAHGPTSGSPRGSRVTDTPALRIHPVGDPHRADVEAFIRQTYAQRYGADVRQFAPTLVSLRDTTGIVSAAGYRSASGGPLFLERYFDTPIDSLLANPGEAAPARDRIVEIGHLSAAGAGEGRRLILLLAAHLQSRPFEWMVSTMGTGLRHLFLRLGITPLALGRADPHVLGSEATQWGSFYEHHPVVLAGRLHRALGQLAHRRSEPGHP